MTNPPPSAGPLADWLRQEARAPFVAPRGDEGDALPLAWLVPAIASGELDEDRLSDALTALLGEADAEVSRRLLEASSLDPPPSLRAAVARAVALSSTTLAALDQGAGVYSLLKLAVHLLDLGDVADPLSPETLEALAHISSERDGWPVSVAVGLRGDPDRFVPLGADVVTRATDAAHQRFWLSAIRLPESTLASLLPSLRAEGSGVAAWAGEALQEALTTRERARQFAAQAGHLLPTEESATMRWARYASALGLPA